MFYINLVNNLLKEITDGGLSLGETGHASFRCDDIDFGITVNEELELLTLFSVLGNDGGYLLGRCVKMLNLNNFQLATGGGTLGVNEKTLDITFTFQVSVGQLNKRLLYNIINNFIETSFFLHEGLGFLKKEKPRLVLASVNGGAVGEFKNG